MKIQHRVQLIDLLNEYELPKRVVECGVAEGRFSEEVYNKGVEHLYLVDIWESVPFIDGCASFSEEWHCGNYNRVVSLFKDKPNVTILKGFSHKVASEVKDNSLGLVYIDGDHSYKGVMSDIHTWMPKLVSGGIMAFHDYANEDYGVKRAVVEYVRKENKVNIIQEDGKTENIGAWIKKQ